jgi:dTDP-glucose 4,6-dehydratase
MKNILVTGGCGFIGCNFIRYLFNHTDFSGRVINLDKLTYAGNLENTADIASKYSNDRYAFVPGDIADEPLVGDLFVDFQVDTVCHFAAESHVDRSIVGARPFIDTNIVGTYVLLEAAKTAWAGENGGKRFHHVSTDEVYGSLGPEGYFVETTAYDPRSPYSASKAASDHLVRAYYHTHGVPVTLSNCSNNYGPYQFPEKLIPVTILNALNHKQLPVYGKGQNVRDWLHVFDHCAAIWLILQKGVVGETYNIGGDCQVTNLELVQKVCDLLMELKPLSAGGKLKHYRDLITFVTDRPGHDFRYAIDCSKIKRELGWKQGVAFQGGLKETIESYIVNVATPP